MLQHISVSSLLITVFLLAITLFLQPASPTTSPDTPVPASSIMTAANAPIAETAVKPGIADSKTYLTPLAKELNKTWPKNRTINIICHGHSVPAGYFNTPRVDTFNSYPHLMHLALNERYPNAVINVITTAIGGEASPAGAERFRQDVLTHQPDLLLIDYALNDRGKGLKRSEAAWREMIETALDHEIPVMLLTPTPSMKANLNDPKDPLNQHAQSVRDLAAEYNVALVDSTAAFIQAIAEGTQLKSLMSHNVHPNRQGHQIVAQQLLRWFPKPR